MEPLSSGPAKARDGLTTCGGSGRDSVSTGRGALLAACPWVRVGGGANLDRASRWNAGWRLMLRWFSRLPAYALNGISVSVGIGLVQLLAGVVATRSFAQAASMGA